METYLFWIVWGVLSVWAIRAFYFSYKEDKLNKLIRVALGMSLAVLLFLFLPWFSLEEGGYTGWDLVMMRNLPMIFYTLILLGTTIFFATKNSAYLKYGALANIANSVFVVVMLAAMQPGTYELTLTNSAPVFSVLLLLTNNAVVLLMWQQLELKEKGRFGKKSSKKRR